MNMNDGRPNIMVVDDTPSNLRLLQGMLQDLGYAVRPFPKGRLALKAAENEPPELLLLDINMPEMDGYEVCRRFKEADTLEDIPVIFISASKEDIDRERAFGVGGADFVVKPFRVEEVRARIKTHLAAGRCQTELSRQNQRIREALHELRSTGDRCSHERLIEILAGP